MLNTSMNITLSKKIPHDYWEENTILTNNNLEMIIHIFKKNYLDTIQKAARKIRNQGIKNINLYGKEWDIEKCWAFWMGYYQPNSKKNFACTYLNNNDDNEFNIRYNIINWVRKIIDLPSNLLTPLELVKKTIKFLLSITKDEKAITYEIIKGKKLLEHEYMGIYTVGNGAKNIPVFLHLDYNPTINKNTKVHASLVGKGVTFDSGGYNLKNNHFINFMKSDMSGAAILIGALALAIKRGLKKRIKLYLCCVENMISSTSFKIGDIIKYKNNKTVEVNNTDAEGRLILADGLIIANQDNPNILIDAATLTGAAKIAVGNDYNAIFSFDNKLVQNFLHSAKEENELFWRLPLNEFHRERLVSSFADLSNISYSSASSASTAAAFLSYFVENYKKNWLHIDCSAIYQEKSTDKWSIGATGSGVRTIANFLLK